MSILSDLSTDWLADAALTPEQRRVWNDARAELIETREQLRKMEARFKTLEQRHQEANAATSILTHPEFNREVARMLAFDERYGGASSVLYFDIENLADMDGTAAASIVRAIGDSLLKQCRSSDIIGRLSADEFGVLLSRCDNAAAWKKGEILAAALYDALAGIQNCEPKPIIGYGAYTFREKENVATGLKQAADAVTRGSHFVTAQQVLV